MSEKKLGIGSWLIGDYLGQNDSNSPKKPPTQEDRIIDLHQRITDLENKVLPRLEELDSKVSKLIEANKNLIMYFSTQKRGSK